MYQARWYHHRSWALPWLQHPAIVLVGCTTGLTTCLWGLISSTVPLQTFSFLGAFGFFTLLLIFTWSLPVPDTLSALLSYPSQLGRVGEHSIPGLMIPSSWKIVLQSLPWVSLDVSCSFHCFFCFSCPPASNHTFTFLSFLHICSSYFLLCWFIVSTSLQGVLNSFHIGVVFLFFLYIPSFSSSYSSLLSHFQNGFKQTAREETRSDTSSGQNPCWLKMVVFFILPILEINMRQSCMGISLLTKRNARVWNIPHVASGQLSLEMLGTHNAVPGSGIYIYCIYL